MEHVFSSGANITTFTLGVLALVGFAWRLLRLVRNGVRYLSVLADLPEIVRGLVTRVSDLEQRVYSLETTTTHTVETTTTRTVEPSPAAGGP